jgi:hypothetical protein
MLAGRIPGLLTVAGRTSSPLPFTASLLPHASQNFELSEHSFPQDWHRIISYIESGLFFELKNFL